MPKNYKIMIRQVQVAELGRLTIADGESLDAHVRAAVKEAGESGMLSGLATRVGLPSISVSEVAEDNDDEIVSIGLYDPAGYPLIGRSTAIEKQGAGWVCRGTDNDQEYIIGVFPNEEVAQQVGAIWRNGHIVL